MKDSRTIWRQPYLKGCIQAFSIDCGVLKLLHLCALFIFIRFSSASLLAVDEKTAVANSSLTPPAPSDSIRSSLEALPSRGSGAFIKKDGESLIAVAVGNGMFLPKSDSEMLLPDPVKRSRAARAAIISAKAALAEQLGSFTSTLLSAAITEGGAESVRSEIQVSFNRTILSRSWPWKVEATQNGSGYSAKAWIYFPDDGITPLAASKTGGLPVFRDNQSAANAVADWIATGLCDSGALRLFVGAPENERLRTFSAGLAPSGPTARTVAEMKATAVLMREAGTSAETIEGSKSLVRETVPSDPLSHDGNSSLLREDFFKRRRSSAVGVIKVAADSLMRRLPDGQTCVVVWQADEE